MFSSAETVPRLGAKAGGPAVHAELEREGYVLPRGATVSPGMALLPAVGRSLQLARVLGTRF